jgi:methionyl-tRNA synthetase
LQSGRKPYLDGFHIAFDNGIPTDGPENHELAQQIYRDLKAAGLIATKTIEQFFDPEKSMFLPDRFIKGECPKCGTKDQYGDSCESCGAVYSPTEVKNPYSALSGATPCSNNLSTTFKLSDPRCVEFLEKWTHESGRLQPEVLNKIKEWFAKDEEGQGGLGDWDISRDAPYFGIEIPDAPGKYFYVWLDAPIGYLASLKTTLGKIGVDYNAYIKQPQGRAVPLHWQRHHVFPHAVLARHAALQRPQNTQRGVCARLLDRQRREDEQEPWHRPRPPQVFETGH